MTRLADPRLCLDLARHEELVLLLDLDGTLIPFAPTTAEATLDRSGVALLRDVLDAGVHVVVVSGRPRALVEPLQAGLDGVWWAAEHGSWRCGHDRSWVGPPALAELDDLARVLEGVVQTPGARLERKSLGLCVHWRLVEPERKESLIAESELLCDEWLEARPDFERIDGVEMLEVRSRSFHKGRAVAWVREHYPTARMIAIGDDRTDEDMFAALREDELAIAVGSPRTRAQCVLPNPAAVRAFLAWVAETRTDGAFRPFLALGTPRPEPPANAALVVVSNRIPSVITGRDRPVGGLVSALEPALHSQEGVWLGWSGGESDGERGLSLDDDDLRPRCAAFDLPPGARDHYYGGLCNRALWPLFHGFPGRARYADDDWCSYVTANDEFARHAHALAAPDGTVWMHDYHLLLAGAALRARGFRGALGLFLHIPFPEPNAFDTLPWADELIRGMVAFDLVGFHTEQWADNFRACARPRLAGRGLPEIGVLPIGVDPLRFNATRGAPSIEVEGLRGALGQRRLILGVDRLDYAKGIPERLLGFERLLERFPEWRAKVSFVQVSVPSRADVPEYAELRRTVENLVGRINGRFGEADWVPVRYLYRSYDHDTLAQLYRLADVALVTPLRDGLNLVAKEFVVAQDPACPGVLLLSRFAGAAAELRDAVITNPFYPDGLAHDLDRALRMDGDERRRRQGLLAATLADKTPQRWAAAFLDRLLTRRAAG